MPILPGLSIGVYNSYTHGVTLSVDKLTVYLPEVEAVCRRCPRYRYVTFDVDYHPDAENSCTVVTGGEYIALGFLHTIYKTFQTLRPLYKDSFNC